MFEAPRIWFGDLRGAFCLLHLCYGDFDFVISGYGRYFSRYRVSHARYRDPYRLSLLARAIATCDWTIFIAIVECGVHDGHGDTG